MQYRRWLHGLWQDLELLDGSTDQPDVTNVSYVTAAYGVLSTCVYARYDDIPAAPYDPSPNVIAAERLLDDLPWTLRAPDEEGA